MIKPDQYYYIEIVFHSLPSDVRMHYVIIAGNMSEFLDKINAPFKTLRLISMQKANEVGIRAEAPVFVSPIINKAVHCGDCSSEYSPLVYKNGYETTAQHFHKDKGGIYYYKADMAEILDDRVMSTCFVGFLNVPTDEEYLERERIGLTIHRATSVYVSEIRAYAYESPSAGPAIRLDEGELFDLYSSGQLTPLMNGYKDKPVLRFKSRDNGIMFSEIPEKTIIDFKSKKNKPNDFESY